MRIGVTGHQTRSGIDWEWTARQISECLHKNHEAIEGWSSLAIGADQLFAQIVLDMGGSLCTVVPGDWYDECFEGEDLTTYHTLLTSSEIISLNFPLKGEEAFLA